MIRGKGFEFQVHDMLKEMLDPSKWRVTKYNTNPQRNATDADLVAKNLEYDLEVILECKTATRGSFSMGGSKRKSPVPHFTVKSHKSRSNKERELTNDRYFADEFDIVFANTANAFIQKGEFALLDNRDAVSIMQRLYGGTTWEDVFPAMSRDVRAALTSSIVEDDGTLPRSPVVQIENDPNWVTFDRVEELLMKVVKRKLGERARRPTRSAHLDLVGE